jgi:hypothetical protein
MSGLAYKLLGAAGADEFLECLDVFPYHSESFKRYTVTNDTSSKQQARMEQSAIRE